MVVLGVMIVLTLLGPMINYRPAPFSGEGNPLRQMTYVMLMTAIAIQAKPWIRPERLLPIPLLLTAGLAWCWISISWSVAPEISLRRIGLTTIVMWTIFLTVRQGNYRDLMSLMRVLLVIFLIANYITSLAFPSVGVHHFDTQEDIGLIGNWRGVMQHKNHAGAVCAFTIIAFIFDARRIKPVIRLLVIGASVVYLYHTMSKTSMGILIFSLFCGWIYIRYNPAYRALLVPLFSIVGVAGYLLSIVYRAEIVAPFSDPQGFTGRVHIWTTALRAVHDRPLFGFGYGGFWNTGDSSPIYQYSDDWVQLIASSHSGYIDLMVQLGIPGMIFVVFAVIVWPLIKLLASQQISRESGALLLAWLLFCAGHNFTETSLFYRDEIVQVFLCLTLALIWRETSSFWPMRKIAANRRTDYARGPGGLSRVR